MSNEKNLSNNSNKVFSRRWNQDYTVEHLPNASSTVKNSFNQQYYKLSKMFALPQINFLTQKKPLINFDSLIFRDYLEPKTNNNILINKNKKENKIISDLIENEKKQKNNNVLTKNNFDSIKNLNNNNTYQSTSISTKSKYCNQQMLNRKESAALLVETSLPPFVSSNKSSNASSENLFLNNTAVNNLTTTTPVTTKLTKNNLESNSHLWWQKKFSPLTNLKTTFIQSNTSFNGLSSEKYKLNENAFEVIHLENNYTQKMNKNNTSNQNSKNNDLLINLSKNKAKSSLCSSNFFIESNLPLSSKSSVDNYICKKKLKNVRSNKKKNNLMLQKDRAGALIEFSKSFKKIKRAKTVNQKINKKIKIENNNLLKLSKSEPNLRLPLCLLFRDFLLNDNNIKSQNVLRQRALTLTPSNCICMDKNCLFAKKLIQNNNLSTINDYNNLILPLSNEINKNLKSNFLLFVSNTKENESTFNTRQRSSSFNSFTDEESNIVLKRKKFFIYNKVKLCELYERSKYSEVKIIIIINN